MLSHLELYPMLDSIRALRGQAGVIAELAKQSLDNHGLSLAARSALMYIQEHALQALGVARALDTTLRTAYELACQTEEVPS
jgi:hypothetical protein